MNRTEEKLMLRALQALGRAADLWVIIAQHTRPRGATIEVAVAKWKEKWDNPTNNKEEE